MSTGDAKCTSEIKSGMDMAQSHSTRRRIFIPANYKGEGKAIPLQAWTGPEGSRRVRIPDFKIIGT
jgi:hypothetical protein